MLDLTHHQVRFTTIHGQSVMVDEGMLGILVELRRLGVDTHYSCQGDDFGGYFLATTKSFVPLQRKILSEYRNGTYSQWQQEVVENFVKGYFEFSIGHFRNIGVDGDSKYIKYASRKFTHGEEKKQCYAYERSYSVRYGSRVTVRWPKDDGYKILSLLYSTR